MKIRVFSDLHLEFFAFEPAEVSADVVVLAGDIQNGHYGLGWARRAFPDTAIVYVMGNVVVTHHLPHRGSVDRQFHRDPLTAFVSHMPELVRLPVTLWIHGHTHCSCDYEPVKSTRVLCNPRGYGPSQLNDRFDQRLVVRI